jgi:VCBS repeat-containing protein
MSKRIELPVSHTTEQETQINGLSHALQVMSSHPATETAAKTLEAISTANRVAIIDPGIVDYQSLIADLPTGTEIIILDPNRDGIEQILEALVGKTGLDAIDIFSHGSEGALTLGSTLLNGDSLADYAAQLAEIGSHLTRQGDILLYGCDVAQGEAGQAFIEQLAQLTGADVAASTDLTGSAALGGDWVLEAQTGAIETAGIQSAYGALLADTPTSGNDVLYGDDNVDVINGLAGYDQLYGFGGNDTLEGGDDYDYLDGGDGDDLLIGGTAGTNADTNYNYLYGGAGNDTLIGGDYAEAGDVLDGGSGNDHLSGLAGNDYLYSYAGSDTLSGGDGDDQFYVVSYDTADSSTLTGGAGADRYMLDPYNLSTITVTDFAVGSGGDVIDLTNLLSYSAGYASGNPFDPDLGYLRLVQSGANVELQWDKDGAASATENWTTVLILQDIDPNTLTLENFAPLVPPDGSSVGLTLTGDANNNILNGSTVVDDSLHGLAGYDQLYGFGGNDTLEGGDDYDYLDGGDGDDLLIGGTAGTNADTNYNYLYGGAGNDTLIGGDYAEGGDVLDGGSGNDNLSGLAGNDYLYSYAGSDTLSGGDGDDQFYVVSYDATDSSTLTGGAGADRYMLDPYNLSTITVTDFTVGSGGDVIDISYLLGYSAGYVSGNPFDPDLGYLRLVQSGANVELQWDKDGAASATENWTTVLTLQDIDPNTLTLENFAPLVPPDGSSVGLTLTGDANNDILNGSTVVDDSLHGLAGYDQLYGFGGNDTLEGGDDYDYLDGGDGDDLLIGGTAGTNADTNGNSLYGGAGNDTLIGGDYAEGGDVLDGGSGNDNLSGLAGNDYLYSYAGSDTLSGGDGDDQFYVVSYDATDSSTLTGGAGADRYMLDPYNLSTITVTDFTVGSGGDVIDISYLLGYSAGYVSGNPFDPDLGYLRLVQSGANVELQWDKDGAASATENWTTVMILQSVNVNDLIEENFYPNVGAPSVNYEPELTGSVATLAAGTEDTAYTVTADDLLQGWSDAEGTPLSVQNVTANHGSVVDNGNGTWTVTPEADYHGPVTLSYGVSDGVNITNASLDFDLTAVNDAPELTGTSVTLTAGIEDTVYTVTADDLLQGWSDVDGDTLEVSDLAADHGTLLDNGDGIFTLTPELNYNGPVTLSYFVNDNQGSSAPATLALNLTAVNDAPQLGTLTSGIIDEVPQSTTQTYDHLSGMLAGSDVDGDVLSYGIDGGVANGDGEMVKLGSYGELHVNTNTGAYYYLRDVDAIEALGEGEAVEDQFTVTVADSQGATALQPYTIGITGAGEASALLVKEGTSGNDVLDGSVDDDSLHGLGGQDTLNGFGGNDILEGGDGSDTLWGGQGDDLLIGGTAGTNADNLGNSLFGEAGDDTLVGGDVAGSGDYLNGGEGSDNLSGLAGNDDLRDEVWYNGIVETNTLDGGAGADRFYVVSPEVLDSSTLTGGAGVDRYILHPNNLSALTVTDFAVGSGGDVIDISQLLNSSTSYASGNPFDANLGYLRLVQNGAHVELQWDKDGAASATQTWTTVLTLQNIDLNTTPLTAENFAPLAPPDGSSIGVTLTGDANNNILDGSVVNDSLHGLGGQDTLNGFGGNDILEGGDGSDTLWGGQGDDLLIGGTAGTNADNLGNSLFGEAGDDTLVGGDVAGSGDYLNGGEGSDNLSGLAGNDDLRDEVWYNGIVETNTLDGGAGADRFYVVSPEVLDSSTLTGGAGVDRYILHPNNLSALTVTDFAVGSGGDVIDISQLLNSSTSYASGNPFDANLGYLRLVQNGAHVELQWDKDGAASATQTWTTVLTLQNIDLNTTPLTAENFAPNLGAPPVDYTPELTGSAVTLTAGIEDNAYTVTADDLLQGWSDAEGSPLSVLNVTANHGSVDDNGDGTWTIMLDTDYNGIVILSYGVSDGVNFANATLDFELTSVNDAPDLTGATATLTDGAEDVVYSVSLADLLQGWSDVDGDTLAVSDLAADHGTVTDNGDGTFTLTPEFNYNGSVTLSYNVTDNQGGSVPTTLALNLAAVNGAAVISGEDTGEVTEAGGVDNGDSVQPTASGQLYAADADNTPNVFQEVADGVAGYGIYQVLADGFWTYTVDENNPDVQALNEGDSPLTDTFTVHSEDGTAKTITIAIYGANDYAQISGEDVGEVIESGGADNNVTGQLIASGSLQANDPDNVVDPFQSVDETWSDFGYGTFIVTADGQWTYTLDDTHPDVQVLNDGDILTDTFTVYSADGTDQRTVTITIYGSNDAAFVDGTIIGDITEAGGLNNEVPGLPQATGTLSAIDMDNAPNAFQAVSWDAASDSGYGTYQVSMDGTWIYTLDDNHPDVQALNDGDALFDSFTVYSEDGTPLVISIAITGVNDTAEISGALAGEVTEAGGIDNGEGGAPTAAGIVFASDVDNIADTFQAVLSDSYSDWGYGTYQITADGQWTFTLDETHADVQALNEGDTLTDRFTVYSEDNTPQVVTITILGGNDAAVISGEVSGTVTEAGGYGNDMPGSSPLTGLLLADDVDNLGGLFQEVLDDTLSDGGYGTYQISADGTWTYTLNENDAAVQALNVLDDPLVDIFTVYSEDGTAQQVTVLIQGADDASTTDLNGAEEGVDTLAAYLEHTPVLIAPDAVIGDIDSPNLTSMTVTLTDRPDGDGAESLSLSNDAAAAALAAGLSWSYTAGTGVLSISGSASQAVYQTILNGIQYNNTSNSLTTTTRTVSVAVNDGYLDSVETFISIDIMTVNDSPVIAGMGGVMAYTENGAAKIIDSSVTVTDNDSTNFNGGSLTIEFSSNGTLDDQLAIRNQGVSAGQIGVSGSNVTYGGEVIGTWSGGSSGSALVIDFTSDSVTTSVAKALIQNITYANSSNDPSTLSRTVSFTLVDGDGVENGGLDTGTAFATINVTAVNDAPVTDLNGAAAGANATAVFIEQTPVLIAPAAVLGDVDSPNLSSMTVTLNSLPDGASESLSLNSTAAGTVSGAGLEWSYNSATGVLSISGSATQAVYQSVLNGIVYNDSSDAPSTTTRTLTVVVNDGSLNSVSHTVSLSIVPVNDAPVISGMDGVMTYVENAAPTVIDASVTVSDIDSLNFYGGKLTVSFAANGISTDNLSILNQGMSADQIGIKGSSVYYGGTKIGSWSGGSNGTNLTITFTSTNVNSTVAMALIQSIAYSSTSNAPDLSKTVSFSLTDGDGVANGGADTAIATATIDFTEINNAPVAVADKVITNAGIGSEFLVPEWALLANDQDADSDFDLVAGSGALSSVAGGTASHTDGSDVNGSVGFTDSSPAGGSFTYTITDGSLTASATATVSQDTKGALDGSNGSDILIGKATSSTLNGNGGNDILVGGAQGDTLNGGSGNDILAGGGGNDILTGGTGVDTYKWMSTDIGGAGSPAVDTIKDFGSGGKEVLDLGDLLVGESADANSLDSYLNFSYNEATNTSTIDVSSNGTGAVDQQIVLQNYNITTLGANDAAIINTMLESTQLTTDA